MKRHYESEETPEGRLGVIFRKVVEKVTEDINRGRTSGQRMPFPLAPGIRDYEDLMRPYIQKECLTAALNAVTQNPRPTVQELRTKIAALDRFIRENPL
jgi:hypothetical protein